jgi:glycosyltransferase involved in cell wall biosynthesis
VDLTRFDATTRPETSEPVIGTVAALRPEKNLARLLHAVSLFSHRARLVIIGDGPERPMLESLAATLGIAERVTFAGHRADPRSAYDGFDIFALSSDTEQMPLSVLEAMASGLPVASTDVGDVRAMVAPENAPFVVPAEEAALAGALDRLLADPGPARAIGSANRREAERRFGLASMFDAHRAAWDGAPAG